MSGNDLAQLLILVIALAVTIPLLGGYMARVFDGSRAPGERLFAPLERGIYAVCGIDPDGEQRWRTYAVSLLTFSGVSMLLLYGIERLQDHLPLNPSHATGVPAGLAFNTAASFLTNTNWQNYSGETAMSILTQMIGLTVQNFVSAAVGIAVAVVLMRGLIRRRSSTIGSFWVDLVRIVVRILLPIAIVAAIVLVSMGVIQDLTGPVAVHTLAGGHQTLPTGAIASQEAIKDLGTNGGGPFNANSSHPFENPTGFTNLFEIWLLLAIPFSLPWTFGRLARDRRQGLAVLGAMVVLWAGLTIPTMALEAHGNTALPASISQTASPTLVGGNLEGKEIRFGAAPSALFGSSTTATSTGSVDSSHDSFTPLGGGLVLTNMMLGEVSPGGTGSGLYGMLVLALVSVFIAGLMVGRTPEYLGKKVQAAEMKLVAIYILIVPAVALGAAATAIATTKGMAALLNPGPHGLSEMVYAFVSTANNNGSAFAGFSGNVDWFNVTSAFVMLAGRFALIVPVLAIAGSLARKQPVPASAGTLPTDTALFAVLLAGVTVIIVGLTYFPVLALGPIAEQVVHR
jgi:potassium-transporting ATPase potassium-binding subunit